MVRRVIFAALCALAPASASPAAALNPDCSVSTSRQFLVYGSDIRLRGAICELAESTKRDALQLIGERDGWIAPIIISSQPPQANFPEMPLAILSLGQTGGGLRLQLNLKITSDLTQPEIRRQLLRAVLVEMMYRRVPDLPAGTNCSTPPEWLVDGLLAKTETLRGAETPLVAVKVLAIEEFLSQRPDSLGRSLYRAYSGALVDLLLRLPEGRRRLARFIFDFVSVSEDGFVNLRVHFPELFDPARSLRKFCLSPSASLPAGQPLALLSAEETERILIEILSVQTGKLSSGERHQLHEFPVFIHDLSTRPALGRLSRDLAALTVRACPVYRPVTCEYERIVIRLARGKTNGIAKRLARLSASRKVLAIQMRKIGDYMNWFEAARSRRSSGLFDQFMKTADSVDRTGDRRRDPISVYLDVLETEFQN